MYEYAVENEFSLLLRITSIAKSWKSDDFYDRTNYFHPLLSLMGGKKDDFFDGRNYSFILFVSFLFNFVTNVDGKFVRNLERDSRMEMKIHLLRN